MKAGRVIAAALGLGGVPALVLAGACTYGGYDESAHAAATGSPIGLPGGGMGAGAGPAGAGAGMGAGAMPAGDVGAGMGPGMGAAPMLPSGASVSGTIRLADSLAGKALPTDTLYIIVRPAPVGPPVAVKKVAAPRYPVTFAITDADLMGGSASLAGSLWVLARVDRDGNAGPAEPGDLEGTFSGNPAHLGSADVDVVIDREIGPGGAGAPVPGAGMAMPPGAASPFAAAAGPYAGGSAPFPAAAPAPAPFAAAAPAGGAVGSLSGSVDIDPAQAAKVAPTDTLFIIVRNAPVGPPLAVKRIVGPAFPVSFDIGPADAMAGPASWTGGPYWLAARLDKDGNAMSKNPGDVAGKIADPIPGPASGLHLLLNEPL
ncbi:MAG TPA: hypothetical protein VG389_19830 [Myxococcota bacterium]|nr:hypothetical protein [Myxococcota bacterium]